MHGEYTGCVNESKQEKDMEFDEWYDRMMDNGDSPLHYLVTQREKMRLVWNESRRISDTPILSAAPSEEWKQIFREIWDIGNELAGADNPEDFFEIEFEKWKTKRGIAG